MKIGKVNQADIERIAEKTLLAYGANSPAKQSRFWILLFLAGIIATAGVAADSAATVVGAMIVAPLMTPIMGTAFALVVSQPYQLMRSLLAVIGGVLMVIGIAFLFSMLQPEGLLALDNSQIAARVSPRLIDLLAALATGMVGAFALVRSDVSDTLPGVAIAISLVPPLAVVGLTLQHGEFDQALGAFLLFSTNVAAIILVATLVLLLYRVREVAMSAGYAVGSLRGRDLAVVIGIVILVTIPLTYGSMKVIRENRMEFIAANLAGSWADANKWKIIAISVQDKEILVTAIGPPPEIAPDTLREVFDDAGYADFDLKVRLIVGGARELPGTINP